MSNGKIVIDEKEAEVIRQIFHDYRCGMTMSELATRLWTNVNKLDSKKGKLKKR